MKKYILVITLLLLCGCTNINNASVQDITKEVLGSKINSYNEYRTGISIIYHKDLMLIRLKNIMRYLMMISINITCMLT